MTEARTERWYRAVWRWHFYAGLFCIPFVLWLSVTGGIYLFKPQIEDALYAPYRGVATALAPRLAPDAIAAQAVAAVPGSALHAYVLPQQPNDAVQVLVGNGAREVRVWVHPQTGTVLHKVPEEDRLMRVVFRLHGELLAGNFGSALVEMAACWTLVMLLTGLFLWWPRGAGKLAGVIYPRLRQGRAALWRDLHAVTGLWISIGALFLIASGLPWANAWGAWLRDVRTVTGTADGPQDWSAGSRADSARRAQADAAMRGAMAGHMDHAGMADMPAAMPMVAPAPAALDAVVGTAQTLHFAAPVQISPPTAPGGAWQVSSQAENRPKRDSAQVAGDGTVVGIRRFADRHWIDRAVGYGVAIHEGAWAGLANQLVNLTVLIGLVLLCVSSVILWWRRRPQGALGAPRALAPLRHSWMVVAAVIVLALAMPLFGVSLALVVLAEAAVGRLAPAAHYWMGWRRIKTTGSRSP